MRSVRRRGDERFAARTLAKSIAKRRTRPFSKRQDYRPVKRDIREKTPAPAPDFSLAATSAGVVTVTALNGFSGAVALSASGLPAGATASFAPASINGAGTSTLTVNAPPGTYNLTITGTSGSLSHQAAIALSIAPTPAAAPAAIGVNFVGRGTPMSAAETAGVAPKPNWNNAAGAASTAPLALNDEFARPTGATVQWSSDLGWSVPSRSTAGTAT